MEQSIPKDLQDLQYVGDQENEEIASDKMCRVYVPETCVNGKCVMIGFSGIQGVSNDQVINEAVEKVDDAPGGALEMGEAHP